MAKFYGSFIHLARVQAKPHNGIMEEDIMSFFEHLSTLLNSGVTLLRALNLSIDQSESIKLQKALRDITNKVAGGSSLYDAISHYPKIFPHQWAQLIKTGEQSGQLANMLEKLNASVKRRAATVGKVKSALIYPAIMAIVAVAAIVIMLWKVIPTFAQFFTDFGSKLPAITQFVLDMSNFVQKRGLAMVVFAIAFYFGFKRFIKSDYGGRQWFSFLMAFPVAGEVVIQGAQEQFASNMALLMKSGMPLLEALKATQDSFKDNPIYYDALGEVYHKVSTGGDLGNAIQSTGFFTKMTVGMVKMGEESGKLAEVLDVISVYYGEKVQLLVLRLTSLLEPVIVIGMGIVVAGMLGSVYLPMFQLSGAAN